MKAVECYCGIFQGDEIRTTRGFVDFPTGDAILPNDILLLSDARMTVAWTAGRTSAPGGRAVSIRRPSRNGRRFGPCATNVSSTFRPASFIIFTTPLATNSSMLTRTAVRPAIRLRKRSSKVSSNSSSGMRARFGGTIACNAPRSTSISLATVTFGICERNSLRWDAACGSCM
jgi:hypothetical protein